MLSDSLAKRRSACEGWVEAGSVKGFRTLDAAGQGPIADARGCSEKIRRSGRKAERTLGSAG